MVPCDIVLLCVGLELALARRNLDLGVVGVSALPYHRPHRTIHVQAMKTSCIGTRIHSGMTRCPRSCTPRRTALILAGSISISRRINPQTDHTLRDGSSNPTAPASSAIPVMKTRSSGRGSERGTIAIRSFRIGAKCEVPVKRNIVTSAARALASQGSS